MCIRDRSSSIQTNEKLNLECLLINNYYNHCCIFFWEIYVFPYYFFSSSLLWAKRKLLEDHYILVEEAPCDDNDWKKVPTKLSSAWINEDEKFFLLSTTIHRTKNSGARGAKPSNVA